MPGLSDVPRGAFCYLHATRQSLIGSKNCPPLFADQYVALLNHFGHRAVSVPDGDAAMRLVARQTFDAVICGLKLAGFDGFALAALLRAHPHTSGARLLAISGAAGENLLQRARMAGFDAHHCKPVSIDDILKSLS